MTPGSRRIVLTGGPGAGKTAVLEMVKHSFCGHVAVTPESASLLFSGGFPRDATDVARRAAQRAIFHVQIEVETIFEARPETRVVLCDRGTIDGVAYWPGGLDTFFPEVGTTLAAQLARYDAVIHLAPPMAGHGYHRNGVRHESAAEAAAIDARIVTAWSTHPRRFSVESTPHFLQKAQQVLALITAELPAECVAGRCALSSPSAHLSHQPSGA